MGILLQKIAAEIGRHPGANLWTIKKKTKSQITSVTQQATDLARLMVVVHVQDGRCVPAKVTLPVSVLHHFGVIRLGETVSLQL